MITRVVLGTNTELLNVSDVQEVIQNNGEYIKRALTINVTKDSENHLPSVTSIEDLFRAENALNLIKVYKIDIVETNEEGESIYSDEYLESEHREYSTIQSIVKHSDGGMISIVLIVDPTDIAGDKAKQLEEENEMLRMNLSLSTMEIFNAINMVATNNEINQATMLMEILSMIETLQGGE